jgi:hypothetical protein
MDLIATLKEIDAELDQEGVEIFRRPIHAMIKLGQRNTALKGMPLFPIANPSTPLEMVPETVNRWYIAKYGERLKTDWVMGCYPIFIGTVPWKATVHLMYGELNIFGDRNLKIKYGPGGQSDGFNILGKIEHLTQSVVDEMNDEEVERVCEEYVWAMDALTSLSSMKGGDMLGPAIADYNSGVNILFSKNPENGQIKWSSLQFAEKIIKHKLEESGIAFVFTHNLTALAALLNPICVLDQALIDQVQCSAGARYGKEAVTRAEAVKAIQSALKIFAAIYPPNSFSTRKA